MGTLKAKDLIITPATILKEKPDPNSVGFGTVFTDHMLTIEWSSEFGWEKPHIKPFQNLSLHPASSALHYAVELFEGMKAFRDVDNKIRLFRPHLNMDRMHRSALRATLPGFDKEELMECILQLVKLDQEWVPYSTSASLYIRPTLIGTEPSLGVKKPTKAMIFVILSPVGSYFSKETLNPVSLWTNPKFVRAWKGGTGDCKMGGNYGSSLFAQCEAVENGCQQVLWLHGEDNQITEVGTMNLFLYWINEDGEEELATPPLDGIILPGVTRQSILDLARKWGEFKVSERYLTMGDLTTALEQNRVKEMFGSGTACIVCPVSDILYKGETLHIPSVENGTKLATRILDKLTDIQRPSDENSCTGGGGSLSPACSQSGSPQGWEVTQPSGEGDAPITPLLLPLPQRKTRPAGQSPSKACLCLGLALGLGQPTSKACLRLRLALGSWGAEGINEISSAALAVALPGCPPPNPPQTRPVSVGSRAACILRITSLWAFKRFGSFSFSFRVTQSFVFLW
ncbi:Branched-chain-amino-acid aminotransferase, cytosolic [Myotis davidii]|uniref:Branched-chain-amino-acid aminotransferase n=1 Tax=Myotis davidii TaxID=225400 RepID=L5LGE1_MYODS|nr:Branched-chain-amino-acid aminotransferase, cytosolic [Myotis davidii]